MIMYQYQEKPKAKKVHCSAQKEQSEEETDEKCYCQHEQEHTKNSIKYKQKNSVKMDKDGNVIINNLNSLVAEQVTDLVNISIQQNVKQKINNLKTKLYIPKIISLSIITGILSFIIAFPETILENPVLKKINCIIDFIENPNFIWWWLLSFIITMILWCILFFYEGKKRKKLSILTLESEQNLLFKGFTESVEDNRFFKDDLTRYISKQLNNFMIDTVTIMDISQDISNLIINKAIDKGIIEVATNTDSLSDEYVIL